MEHMSSESLPKGSNPLLTVIFLVAIITVLIRTGSEVSKERRAAHAEISEILASVPTSGPGNE